MQPTLPLPRLIAERAAGTPNRRFIQEIGGTEETYREFHQRSLAWASLVEQTGVSPLDTVATLIPASATAYHCWMGLAWLGAIEVPVNHEYQGAMLVHILNDSQASVLVASARFLARIAAVAGQLASLETVVITDATEVSDALPFRVVLAAGLLEGQPGKERTGPSHWDTASIIYTSGTTGASKGVICSWALLAEASDAAFPAEEIDPSDDGGYYCPWQPFHLTGRTALEISVRFDLRLVIRERFSMSSFWDDVRAYRCTHFFSAFIGAWMWRQPEQDDDGDNPLKRVLMAPLISEYREFEARFNVRLSTSYASVEAGFPVESAHDPVNHRICGRVRPGYEIRIVDEHDEEVPVGETGEMVLRSDLPWKTFGGYFNNPEATAAAWRNGWFHTGDAFTIDPAGNLYLVDRLKDYIKYRGQNVSAAEVEASVCEHPAVAECACVGVPSDLAVKDVVGGDDIRIFVVTNGAEVGAEELMAFLVTRMPRFMLPRYIDFVPSLPKNQLHKVTKPELRARRLLASTWDREASGLKVRRS